MNDYLQKFEKRFIELVNGLIEEANKRREYDEALKRYLNEFFETTIDRLNKKDIKGYYDFVLPFEKPRAPKDYFRLYLNPTNSVIECRMSVENTEDIIVYCEQILDNLEKDLELLKEENEELLNE